MSVRGQRQALFPPPVVFEPGAKLQLPRPWRCYFGRVWDCRLTSPGFVGRVCAHINSVCHPVYAIVWPGGGGLAIQASAAAINNRAEWKTACVERQRKDARCGTAGVFRVTGWTAAHPLCSKSGENLLAIVAPCLLAIQRAERGDFSSAEPMTSTFCSKWFSPGPSPALLSSLSLLAASPHCSGRGQARLAVARLTLAAQRRCGVCVHAATVINNHATILLGVRRKEKAHSIRRGH